MTDNDHQSENNQDRDAPGRPDRDGTSAPSARARPAATPPPGYRSAPPPQAPVPALPHSRASAVRIMDLADLHVAEFAAQTGANLDLPTTTAACVYLVGQAGHLAMTTMRVGWERSTRRDDAWSRGFDEMSQDFGPAIEQVMSQHADLILANWRADRRRW